MNDEAIIATLRHVGGTETATVVAEELARVAPGGLTQATVVSYFKRAFPGIPLRTLLEAGAWRRVSAGELTDEDLDNLLSPWLPTSARRHSS
jgi:hypothetical protein